MKRLLIVVDMQNDFITGVLGSPQAEKILPLVKGKIKEYKQSGGSILFTRDTHDDTYLMTQEGKYLPVAHCLSGTEGHLIADGLIPYGFVGDGSIPDGCEVFDKPTFGSLELGKHVAAGGFDEVELCGLCSDICVISNALILKAHLPETRIIVDALCCAGVTEESHKAALLTMKMCQVDVINREENYV